MEDSEIQRLLSQLGLEKYSKVFQDNNIDDESLRHFEKDDLASLIPALGDRLRFWTAISKIRSGEVYSCFKCGEKFQSLKDYADHLKVFHKMSRSIEHMCHICGSLFEWKQFLLHFRNIFKFHPNLLQSQVVDKHVSNNCDQVDLGEDIEPSPIIEKAILKPQLHKLLSKLIAGILRSGKVPMSTKDEIFILFKEFVDTILKGALSISTHVLNSEVSMEQKVIGLQEILGLGDVFSNFDTKYKLDKYLTENGFLIPPKEIVLDTDISFREIHGTQRQVYSPIKMQYVPIRDSIRQLLHKPGFFEMLEQSAAYNGSYFNSFRSGKFFRDSKIPRECICINIYFDEAEVTNPLGSKSGKHKLANFYYTVLDMPPHYLSSTDNIILLCSLKSVDLKLSSANSVVGFIVKELLELWEFGVDFEYHGKTRNIKVVLGQPSGDNLGIHSILGFSEGFTANFPCRRCKMHRTECQVCIRENPSLLRVLENYEQDIRTGNLSTTGINFESVLNKLPYHHVTKMYVFDIMHDMLEGVIPDFLTLFFNYAMRIKYFGIDKLNYRIESFNYGKHFRKSKRSHVKSGALKGDTKSGQNSSQNLCLIICLPLMLGDLIPENDPKWSLLLLLREIVDILIAPTISKGGVVYLDSIISEYCHRYQVEFSKLLKPKHHHLIHYAGAIKQIGTLKQYWCMAFEARHKIFKTTAHAVCNFKNIAKTLAYRHQLARCFSLLSQEQFSPFKFTVPQYEYISLCNYMYKNILLDKYDYTIDDKIKTSNLIICNNSEYRIDCFVVVKYCSQNCTYGKIVDIILQGVGDECQFVVCEYSSPYIDHLSCFKLENSNQTRLVNLNALEHYLYPMNSFYDDDLELYLSLPIKLV